MIFNCRELVVSRSLGMRRRKDEYLNEKIGGCDLFEQQHSFQRKDRQVICNMKQQIAISGAMPGTMGFLARPSSEKRPKSRFASPLPLNFRVKFTLFLGRVEVHNNCV